MKPSEALLLHRNLPTACSDPRARRSDSTVTSARTTSTISTEGQVDIPLHVRRNLELKVGDRIEFVEIEHGMFAIEPVNGDVRLLKGLLRRPSRPVRVKDMNPGKPR